MAQDTENFAESVFDDLFVDDEEILGAGANCAFFEIVGDRAVTPIVARLCEALADGQPLSLVRVGNGEGNAIGLSEHPTSVALFDAFDVEFVSQNGRSVSVEQAVPFSRLVVDAITTADIQGYRIGSFDERAVALECLKLGKTSPALGITYARWLFDRQLRSPASYAAWFTNAWIHFDLMKHFEPMVERARQVIVISGRSELAEKFADRLGPRMGWFASVPVQGTVPSALEHSHYAMFEDLRKRIAQSDLTGTLVLVGAGLFGKVYCNDARKAGAVAVDLGSAFDLLAGVSTRPIHRHMDIAAAQW